MRKLGIGIALIGFGTLQLGCGTTHHFVPERPLAENENRISVSWHYDFSGIQAVDFLPVINIYEGLGNGWNAGLGLKLPLYINSISAAKYWDDGNGDYWMAHLHTNQWTSVNSNPYVELGVSYIDLRDTWHKSISAGVAFGHGLSTPLVAGTSPIARRTRLRGALLPYARCEIGGHDGGASVYYYHGLTARALKTLSDAIEKTDSVHYTFSAQEVDSIAAIDSLDRGWTRDVYGIFLANGDTVLAGRHMLCGTGMIYLAIIPAFPDDDHYILHWLASRDNLDLLEPYHDCNLDIEELKQELEAGRTIILSHHPPTLRDRIRLRLGQLTFFHDLSIGAAYTKTEIQTD